MASRNEYVCIDCYSDYLLDVETNGSSSIVYSFTESEATAHLDANNTHELNMVTIWTPDA